MAKKQKSVNPFYVLLVLAGVAFGLTALAYGASAAMWTIDPVRARQSADQGVGLVAAMDGYGVKLLVGELAVLLVATVLAIGTDRFWTGQSNAEPDSATTATRQTETIQSTNANLTERGARP